MPFNIPLPAEGTEPWYVPLVVNFIGGLRDFANAIEASVVVLNADKLNASEKGAPSGVASLDSAGKLIVSQLPAIALVEYLGASANQAAMLAKTGQPGDWTIRTDLSTTWVLTAANPALLASWTQLSYPTAPVTTVAGRTGAIVLAQADITGLTAALTGKASNATVDALATDVDNLETAVTAKVPTTRTVAGRALSADVPRAGLATVGVAEAVFIANGGTPPVGTPANTLVIEAGA